MDKLNDGTGKAAGRHGGRWSQDRRLELIDFRLRWDGRINRGDLTEYFGISVPQASLDIARYLEMAPRNLEYDRRSRVYVAAPTFKPLFPSSDAQRYLNGLLAQATGGTGVGESFVGWLPPIAAVPSPARRLDGDVLSALLRAIKNEHALSVVYQSIGKSAPTTRTMTPMAIAHDGFRWHVRAFCHSHKDFRDFVIARILKVLGVAPAGAKAEDDAEWRNVLQLVLAPHPGLSPAARRAIEFDYGMTRGQVVFECRQALLFYVLRHLGLSQARDTRPEAQQIILRNAKALEPYLKSVPVG